MTTAEDKVTESRPFEAQPFQAQPFQADVAKLLQLMVHSVYADKSVFLRELIANAADACERLRYEGITDPKLLGGDFKPRITLTVDAEAKRLTVEDNGIGMSREELAESLGTIARSGTKAFLDRIEAKQGETQSEEQSALVGRVGGVFRRGAAIRAAGQGAFRLRAGSDRHCGEGRRAAGRYYRRWGTLDQAEI